METPQNNAAPVLTVGHSNRTWAEFVEILLAAKVQKIIDVRRFPTSSRHPHFNGEAMAPSLARVEIAYRHMPDLGGYRRPHDMAAASPNSALRSGFLRNYADYALTRSFETALRNLQNELTPGSAIMCAEKNWADCHRQIISDYLLVEGWRVVHLLDAALSEDGKLSDAASIGADGKIYYEARCDQFQFRF